MRLAMKPALKPYVPSTPHVTQFKKTNKLKPMPCSCTGLTQSITQPVIRYSPFKNSQGFLGPVQPNVLPHPAQPGKRWMEYQGIDDWAGLLDPLDEGLRAEILRYGNFVEAAYRSFEFDPSSPSYGCCKYPKKSLLEDAGFPGTGYQLSKNLRATSGVQLPLPSWAGAARSSWPTLQSSWVGYVAVCQDKEEIERLGRRDIVISLRGTATCLEWLENLHATLAPIAGPSSSGACNVEPMVESGFLSLYTSGTEDTPSLQDTIRQEVARILEVYPDEPLSFTITGHSLGAALATLAAYDIRTTFKQHSPMVTVLSFGGPRVGNQSFRSLVDKQGTKILRIVNPSDLITKVPGFVIDNNDNHCKTHKKPHPILAWFWPSNWFQKRVEETQWVYAEVGCELRLTNNKTEQQPYYLSNMNVAKCHDLKTYLELVRGLSTNCPLKSSAKRLLNKPSYERHTSQTTTITTTTVAA